VGKVDGKEWPLQLNGFAIYLGVEVVDCAGGREENTGFLDLKFYHRLYIDDSYLPPYENQSQ